MEPELVMVGHIINETIEYPDRRITPVLGSPAAYSSVVAARLGMKTGLVTKEESLRVPAFATKVKDLTGAGDSYSAGFLVEYLRSKDPYQSALFAAATASLVIEGSGGVLSKRMPTTLEVKRRVARAIYGR